MNLDERQLLTPQYFEILSPEDQIEYRRLQVEFSSQSLCHRRNFRISIFTDIFEKIQEFCQSNDIDKAKRFLVCGICWFCNYIAVNNNQLKILISKSKTSINAVLQSLGYVKIKSKGEPSNLLVNTIPYLFGNYLELRRWSIRQRNNNRLFDEFMSDIENDDPPFDLMNDNDFFFNDALNDFDIFFGQN